MDEGAKSLSTFYHLLVASSFWEYCSPLRNQYHLVFILFRHLERLDKAAKSRRRAAMNNAKSISIGPLVFADKPKTTTTMMSNIPKIALTSISGRGCFVQFILFFILSFVRRLEVSLSLKTCFLLPRGPNSILPV